MPTSPSDPNHLSSIRSAAKEGIARRLFADAEESAELLRALGDEIARVCDCQAVHGPIKGRDRAREKVDGRLGGEWFDLRDAVRMTLVAPNESALRRVQSTIRERCVPSNRMGIIRDFEQLAKDSPCGYSGVNIAVRLQNDRPGEIQANTPEMMFGQLSEAAFCTAIGEQERQRIARLKGVEGSLGHVFYELYRVAPTSPDGQAAAQLSRRYFDCLRGNIGLAAQRQLTADIEEFRRLHPSAFEKH